MVMVMDAAQYKLLKNRGFKACSEWTILFRLFYLFILFLFLFLSLYPCFYLREN